MRVFKLILVALVFLITACQKQAEQAYVESKFAGQIIQGLKLHEVASPQSPVTNLIQIFQFVKHGYPYGIHHEFEQFGQNRGFTNSVAEKYIFFLPNQTGDTVHGQVVCISARPFESDGQQKRIYISKDGLDYVQHVISEANAMRFLQAVESTVVLPPTHVMPTPSDEARKMLHPPFVQEYEDFVWKLSERFGLESSMPVRWLLYGLIALVLLGLPGLWVWRRTRR